LDSEVVILVLGTKRGNGIVCGNVADFSYFWELLDGIAHFKNLIFWGRRSEINSDIYFIFNTFE
jgi:hypothetical protein